MRRIFLFLTSILGGTVGYTILFSLLLQLKFIRHAGQTAGQEAWLVAEVLLGSVAVILTLTVVVLAYADREVSKKLLYILTVLGLFLLVLTTAAWAEPFFQPPLEVERFYGAGLIIGNALVVSSDTVAFYLRVPEL